MMQKCVDLCTHQLQVQCGWRKGPEVWEGVQDRFFPPEQGCPENNETQLWKSNLMLQIGQQTYFIIHSGYYNWIVLFYLQRYTTVSFNCQLRGCSI